MSNAGTKGKARRRILVVDDHPIVRNGLSQLINREPDLTVCGEASGSAGAIAAVEESNPDLMLLDIAIEGINGIELTKNLRDTHPDLPVLILSMHDERLYAERALSAGAKGYLMKQEAPGTVLNAIRKVLLGKIYVSEQMTTRIIRDIMTTRTDEDRGSLGVGRLSDRELEVFELIGCGLTTREMAEQLNLSVKTVETHRVHIRHKLRIRSTADLTHQAIRWMASQPNPPWG